MRFLILILLNLSLSPGFALDNEFSNDYFISDIDFDENKVGISIVTGNWQKELAYELDKSNYNVSNLKINELKNKYQNIDLKHRDFLPDPKKTRFSAGVKDVSYEYLGCKIFDESEAYRPLSLSPCSEIKIKIGSESFGIKSKFYYDQKLTDPVIFGNFLIFKIYKGAGGPDKGKPYPASVDGIVVFDIVKKTEVENFTVGDANVYTGAFTSLLKYDPISNLLWIGNNYGLYALNEKLEEKISCFYVKSSKVFDFKCTEADFLDDYKWDQAMFLNKKLTGGKVVDHSKNLNLKMKCLEKIDRKLFDKFSSDPNPKKWEKAEYEQVTKCSRDHSN